MKPVTDPNLLAQLEAPEPITDPALLAQLEGQEPIDNRRWDQKAAEFLQPLSDAADRIQAASPYIMAAVQGPQAGMAGYAINKINEMAGQVAEPITEYAGKRGVSGAGAAALGVGASLLANPLSYAAPASGIGLSTRLAPFKGKPSMGARLIERATGTKASSVERLRRDPGAFFSTASREEAGKAIGLAKEEAGISPGVTGDIKSLTSENVSKARNIQSVANKAQDAVIAKLETAMQGEELPVIQAGAKTGEPHALYAYTDKFGPGNTERAVYNVFGDPNHPIIQKRGWGSSVPKSDLDAAGIPISGRQPNAKGYSPEIAGRLPAPAKMEEIIAKAGITPDEVSTALEGINQRLTKIERSQGSGSPAFQKWSVIKNHFQNMLEQVAPDVKAANKEFSRVALRDEFMQAAPVNQSGTMSKIDAFGFTPAVIGAGALLGGPIGAGVAYLAKTAARSPFIRGAGIATRGYLDKLADPGLSRAANLEATKGGVVAGTSSTRKDAHEEFVRRFITRIQ